MDTDFATLTGLLSLRGYLPEQPPGTESSTIEIVEAVKLAQHYAGLPETGEPDAALRRFLLTPRFCACPDCMHVAEARWPSKAITWQCTSTAPGLSAEQTLGAIRAAWADWAAVCDIAPQEVTSGALVRMEFAPIDRAGSVLAWSELADDTSRPKQQRYDVYEPWVWEAQPNPNKIDLQRVACHEIGHVLGIPHIAGGNLLQPLYDVRIRSPQAGDIREAQARYGPPRQAPPPPPPAPGVQTVVTIRIPGLVEPSVSVAKG